MKKDRKIDKKINRESAIDQGFYDGRFAPKVVPDKKKKGKKDYCKPEIVRKELKEIAE